eukprot:TRINITY_DN3261_c0_g4_i1.p1 TRINITY_DN3261_c0_g4~~TRINITY_DN3261_c0_g4_i1.p1  ORF type:complete len:502 (+),score=91.07 TRINITY_DN3261_c0_g4_i1:35-1507(+)
MTNGLSKSEATTMVAVAAEPLKRVVRDCVAGIHPRHPSCALYTMLLFKSGMRQSVKIYLPLYLASAVVASIRRKQTPKLTLLKKMTESILRSCVFISAHGASLSLFICYFSKLLRSLTSDAVVTRHQQTVSVFSAFVSGFVSSLFEKSDRLREIMIYCCGLTLETIWHSLASKGIVKPLPGGSDLILAAALTVFVYCYFRARKSTTTVMKTSTPSVPYRLMDFMFEPDRLESALNTKLTSITHTFDDDSITKFSLLGSAKVFLLGFGVAMGVKTLSMLMTLMKSQRGNAARANPIVGLISSLVPVLKKSSYLGIFTGLLRLSYKTSPRSSVHMISTLLLSIVFTRHISPPSEISLYVAGKSIESLALGLFSSSDEKSTNTLNSNDNITTSISSSSTSSISYSSVKNFVLIRLLYAVCAAVIVRTALFGDPRHVRLSYWKFLLTCSDGHFYDVIQASNTHNETDLHFIYRLLPPQLQKTRNYCVSSSPITA